ncbi:MAG: DUF2207 domain-containing protein [Elusimicrobia bacterium]|nr:DUF2207 domain-containing protein [Elusimicrobiota bacterium]
MKRFFGLLILPLLCAVLHAQEQIESFDITALIQPDGSVVITETIAVNAQLNKIKRGLVRDIPTTHNAGFMMREDIGLQIISLARNGKEEPFFTERIPGNKLRINFGNDDFLTPGVHVYDLTYKVGNTLVFTKDYDEFYWNVTGTEWDFPILSASARVTLPPGAVLKNDLVSMYAGMAGSNKCNYCSFEQNGDTVILKYNNTLYPGEGFTISAPFSKGAAAEPSAEAHLANFLRQDIFLPLGILLIISGSLYLYWVWLKVGKDPLGAAVIAAEYEPPEGFSPAQLQYIDDMGLTNGSKLLQTMLVSLAVKGLVTIEPKEKFIGKELIIRPNRKSNAATSPEEYVFMYELFSEADHVETNRTYAKKFLSALKKTQENLEINFENIYFSRNFNWFIPFWIPMGALILYILFPLLVNEPVIFALKVIFFMTCVFYPLPLLGRNLLTSVLTILIAVSILASLMFFSKNYMLPQYIIIILLIFINQLFLYLNKAYTVKGREVMDRATGFKKYLSVAEAARVEDSNPENILNIFCNFLPYAIAFGLSNKWIKRYSGFLNEPSGAVYLSGRGLSSFSDGNGGFSAGSFSSALGSFSSSVSSSGAGGGGGVGGGGGGGGGGGR